MKRTARWIAFIFSLVFIFAINKHFLDTSNNSSIQYKKLSANIPANLSRSVKSVYIILVDGLRYESMQKDMEYTKGLINQGKACILKARFEGPSNSRPGYARIFTGSPTAINGIWSNYQEERCKMSSVFETVKQSGLSTGACAFYWVGQLFNKRVMHDRLYYDKNENIQYSYFYSNEEELDNHIFNNGFFIIDKYKPNLFLMHFMEADIAGHRFGGSSLEYSKCIKNTDILIEKFFSKIDTNNSLIMIISDHGHTDRGGHGGRSGKETEVPVILVGNMVKGGFCNELSDHVNIAPTICMLLDVPVAPHMTGRPIDFIFK